jgi:hypothetical protein
MFTHDSCLLGVQRARLEKDTFRHDDFADIVKPAGDA